MLFPLIINYQKHILQGEHIIMKPGNQNWLLKNLIKPSSSIQTTGWHTGGKAFCILIIPTLSSVLIIIKKLHPLIADQNYLFYNGKLVKHIFVLDFLRNLSVIIKKN